MIHYFKKRFFQSKGTILTYHRIASPQSDVWDLAVAPGNFEAQLEMIKKNGRIITLRQMINDIKKNEIKKNSMAITFDDGYMDNYIFAKPLLEYFEIPATFFIITGRVGTDEVFWWDELEQLILFTEQLPQKLTININLAILEFDLGMETILTEYLRFKHETWKVFQSEEPPTKRAQLFLQLWKAIRPLVPGEQKKVLQSLKEWAGLSNWKPKGYESMTPEQIKAFFAHDLFDIGVHTVNHPMLTNFPIPFQKKEIMESKQYLETLAGKSMKIFAYPFSEYN